MRRVAQSYPNTRVRRTADPRASRRQKLLLAGCIVLACGFVFAVSRQIMSVEYGYKTEALRREREQLLDERRRLLLAVEENSSPVHLEQAARGLGMQPATAAQIEASASESAPAHHAQEPHHGGAHVGLSAAAASVMHR